MVESVVGDWQVKPGYRQAVFGAVAFGDKGIVQTQREGGYQELCVQPGRFFRTGMVSIRSGEIIAIFVFMEAADESKHCGVRANVAGWRARERKNDRQDKTGQMKSDLIPPGPSDTLKRELQRRRAGSVGVQLCGLSPFA